MQVVKTWTKTLVTMDIGAFKAREIVLQCPNDQAIFCSSQLRSLAPHKCTYGFDVIEYIGKELFVHCRNEREIRKALGSRNIFVSEREIGYLGKKFVVYLALAHAESREKLVQLMKKRGGYILHVDGTCEGDSPHLFCGMDGISELVLDNIKIPSEKKELLIPFFQRIGIHYGDPVALVHDMGIGILSAIEQVFPGIPDFICHFHFLRDVGKDLLLDDYQTIIQRLRKHKVRALLRQKARYLGKKIGQDAEGISDLKAVLEKAELQISSLERIPALATYTLIHWIFESPRLSRGYGFPFDRPHLEFYRRLKRVHGLLRSISGIHLRNKAKDNRPFIQINKLLEEVLAD
ncbi:MAG: transposase, partial [Methanosarcinaceae archaeon]|nr:transposase [Methanosarcinaceae archaeon]